jgi:hypothetical protein
MLPILSMSTPPTAGPSAAPALKLAMTGAIVRVRFSGVLYGNQRWYKRY